MQRRTMSGNQIKSVRWAKPRSVGSSSMFAGCTPPARNQMQKRELLRVIVQRGACQSHREKQSVTLIKLCRHCNDTDHPFEIHHIHWIDGGRQDNIPVHIPLDTRKSRDEGRSDGEEEQGVQHNGFLCESWRSGSPSASRSAAALWLQTARRFPYCR